MPKAKRSTRPGPRLVVPARSVPSSTDTWDKLTVLDREPGKFALARWKNVFIQAWAAQADAPAMQRVQNLLGGKSGPRLGVRSSVSLIGEGLPLPTDEARAGFADMMTDNAKEIVCLAIVVNGSGFASSALRSMVTGMRIAAVQPYELGVFGSIDDLGAWLPSRHEAKTAVKLEPARLCEVLRRVQSTAATGVPPAGSGAPPARE